MKRAATAPTWPNGKPRSMNNAFAILYVPRVKADACRPPKKLGPQSSKVQQSVSALMTDSERQAARILRDNRLLSINLHSQSPAEQGKTALVGKTNSARSQ